MSGPGSYPSGAPRSVRITGWGSYVPERVLTNADLERIVDTSDEWIRTRTGIRERRVAAPHETTATLGAIAAKRAIAVAGLAPDDIDVIIVATLTPDYPMPSTAVLVKEAIGNTHGGRLRRRGGLLGLRLRLRHGRRLRAQRPGAPRARRRRRAAHALRRLLRPQHLHPLRRRRRRRRALRLGRGGRRPGRPGDDDRPRRRLHDLAALGRLAQPVEPRDGAARRALHPHGGPRDLPLRDADAGGLGAGGHRARPAGPPDEVDLFIPHQANIRIIEAVAKGLGLPMERMVVNIDRYGNTSAASVAIALDEAVRDGRIQPGRQARPLRLRRRLHERRGGHHLDGRPRRLGAQPRRPARGQRPGAARLGLGRSHAAAAVGRARRSGRPPGAARRRRARRAGAGAADARQWREP